MQTLNQFIIQIEKQKDQTVSHIYQTETCNIKKYQRLSESYYQLLIQIKAFILKYSFKDIQEEINFFKNIKSYYYSELYFANKVVQLQLKRPPGNKETELAFFNSQLNEITDFFKDHQEFYQYFRAKSEHYDHMFFSRQNKSYTYLPEHQLNNLEPEFSSSHDYLLSQIIANQKLEQFIKVEIACLENPQTPHVEHLGNIASYDFSWTDSKSALIELIYALYAKGSINNGNLDIRELANFFEGILNVKLPDIYRTYQDIKIRQTPTKYIDSLKTSLQSRILDEL